MASTGSEDGARTYQIAGMAGSLRRASFNRALLRAAQEVAPSSLKSTTYDLIK